MGELIFPNGYKSTLDLIETQIAIKLVKDTFERELANELNLIRVSAPLFVFPSSGLNDNLSGVERPVQFDIKNIEEEVQVVQSLAKWKRMALHRYGFETGHGLYTDMNAIRRDEDLDNTHSVYVDQWDWEKVITKEDRTVDYLKETVLAIVKAMGATQDILKEQFPQLKRVTNGAVKFITSQELEDMYPDKTGSERETLIAKEFGTVFLMKIGGALSSGKPHDNRAPDYDDWELNGDILVWDEELQRSLELSSMGIRVDKEALLRQLKLSGSEDRKELEFHKQLLDDKLPLTIGGGIGQSRLCMLYLHKAHVGEVQASVWPKEMIEECNKKGIFLL